MLACAVAIATVAVAEPECPVERYSNFSSITPGVNEGLYQFRALKAVRQDGADDLYPGAIQYQDSADVWHYVCASGSQVDFNTGYDTPGHPDEGESRYNDVVYGTYRNLCLDLGYVCDIDSCGGRSYLTSNSGVLWTFALNPKCENPQGVYAPRTIRNCTNAYDASLYFGNSGSGGRDDCDNTGQILILDCETTINTDPVPCADCVVTDSDGDGVCDVDEPTAAPTAAPTASPTTAEPISPPSASPTTVPTTAPTAAPTAAPTDPTPAPTDSPTQSPSASPTAAPTDPTPAPTDSPTQSPSASSTAAPPPPPPPLGGPGGPSAPGGPGGPSPPPPGGSSSNAAAVGGGVTAAAVAVVAGIIVYVRHSRGAAKKEFMQFM